MKTLTKELAESYIKIGIFPNGNETEKICDLQDIYGHQDYWDCVKWLIKEDTRDNAKKLFSLIWDDTTFNSMMTASDTYLQLCADKKLMEDALRKINKELSYFHIY